MQRKWLHVRCVVAASLIASEMQRSDFSWLTVISFAVLVALLSIAIIATITLVCYYRRRMKAITGATTDLYLYIF